MTSKDRTTSAGQVTTQQELNHLNKMEEVTNMGDLSGSHPGFQIIDQATNLPPKEKIITNIQPIMTLTGRDNYEEWVYVAQSRLNLYRFIDLIPSEIPRPHRTDPQYQLWYTASIAV